MAIKTLFICAVIQISLGRNLENSLKKSRDHYLQEQPGFLPTDMDYSNLFANEPIKPPHKLNDEILSVLHDENTDSRFDKTKIDNNKSNRANFMKWFEDVLKTKQTVPTIISPIESRPNSTVESTKATTTVLTDIVHYLSMINVNLEELKTVVKNNNAYLVVKVPADYTNRNKRRSKRDVNATVIENDEKTDSNTDNNTETNARRFMNDEVDTPNDIKNKLLFYLDEAFDEINKKVEPLNVLKNTYAEENNFKIGYIVANIDTLGVNLNKLKVEMEKNKHLWDDKKVLELFDKLKTSDSVLSSLLGSLKIYVDMKNVYGV